MWPYFLRKRLKTIKSARLMSSAREEARIAARPASDSAEMDNLLYKSIPLSAASRCGKIAWCLLISLNCSLLRPRSGSGKQASRSPAQAEHDSAQQRREQKIHRRRG